MPLAERLGAALLWSGAASVPVGAAFRSPVPMRPVFIVGSGRSGSTLVRRLLVDTRQIHIPPESYVLGPVIRSFATWRYFPWASVVRRVTETFERYPEFHHFEVGLDPIRREQAAAHPESRSLAALIDSIYRAHAALTGAPSRWGDKTPLNVRFLPELHRVFPDARFVHMLRDGCDAVASFLEMGRYDSLRAPAERWRDSVGAVRTFERRHPGAVIEVRYEVLVADPETVVRKLCHALLIDFDPAVLGPASDPAALGDAAVLAHHRRALGSVDAESLGRGRSRFDSAARAELQRLIGPTLAANGYPPADG